jgi:tetratricopeptide (TPR) repeat protein
MELASTARPGIRKRRALALGLLALVLVVAALASSPLWLRALGRDPARLDLLYDAWNEYNAKRYDRATQLLDRRATETAPTPLDWMLRAQIAESQGRLPEALAHLKKIPDTDRVSAQAWLRAGQIEMALSHAQAAEAAYRRALALDPKRLQCYRELAYLYALQRRTDECDAQFRALSERMALDYVLAFAWCQNYSGIWDPKGNRPVLSGFVAADSTDRWSRLALASSYELTTDLEQAEAVLRPLPDSEPEARAQRIQIAIDRGDIPSAEALAREGPADHPRLNSLRGRLALAANEPQKAASFFRAALRADPENRDAIHGLGQALRSLGDPEADQYLQLANRRDQLRRTIVDSVTTLKTDPKLFFKLGELCQSVNRLEEARVWYRLAIKRDPLDTQAHQNLARIEQSAPKGSEP